MIATKSLTVVCSGVVSHNCGAVWHRVYVRQLVVGFQGVAAGLAHIHGKGIVDQDVHAGNIMCTLDGKAWVKADLGSAVWLQENECPTKIPECM